jgi:hypothetical protein
MQIKNLIEPVRAGILATALFAVGALGVREYIFHTPRESERKEPPKETYFPIRSMNSNNLVGTFEGYLIYKDNNRLVGMVSDKVAQTEEDAVKYFKELEIQVDEAYITSKKHIDAGRKLLMAYTRFIQQQEAELTQIANRRLLEEEHIERD